MCRGKERSTHNTHAQYPQCVQVQGINMKKVKNSRNYLTKTCEQFEKNVKQQIKESKARCGWLRTSTKKKEEASGGGTTAGDTVCWILKIRSVAVGSTQWSTNWFNLNTLVHGGKGIRRKTCASGSGTAAGQTALNPNNPNQTGWNCGHKFAVPPFPPKKKFTVPPPWKRQHAMFVMLVLLQHHFTWKT